MNLSNDANEDYDFENRSKDIDSNIYNYDYDNDVTLRETELNTDRNNDKNENNFKIFKELRGSTDYTEKIEVLKDNKNTNEIRKRDLGNIKNTTKQKEIPIENPTTIQSQTTTEASGCTIF